MSMSNTHHSLLILDSMSSSKIAELILRTADRVAYTLLLRSQWSTWHPWNHYQLALNADDPCASKPETLEDFWESTAPYGSCVETTARITRALRWSLKQEPALQPYAKLVRNMARASSTDSGRLTHCVTAVLLEHSCIVIDFSFAFKPIHIYLGTHRDSLPSISMEGKWSQTRLSYSLHHSEPTLMWSRCQYSEICEPRQYVEIDEYAMFSRVSIPMVTATEITTDSIAVPRGNGVKLHAIFDSKPHSLPSQQLHGKHFATVCRIRVDFTSRRVTVLIPYHDWLLKPENRDFYKMLQHNKLITHIDDKMSRLVLRLGEAEDENVFRREANVVATIVQQFAMERATFFEIVDSVYARNFPCKSQSH